ncbi:MAG: sigma-70 family RNA polymerase sigma factor [Acidobacteria bacterium]|nr:sigma-70 family RNA polymerase sigma factor [Acidobacteriota bacterium]
MASEPIDITDLLLRWNAGDAQALERLTPVVYEELRKLARALLQRERPGHTLAATELVHEVYCKLVDQNKVEWENRAHFFGAAANIMRRVLVDHAKRKFSHKRGGSMKKVAMNHVAMNHNDALQAAQSTSEELLFLDTALDELTRIDARKAKVVEMKFFAGMTNKEVARALGTSDATVERDWKMARAWLIQSMNAGNSALE